MTSVDGSGSSAGRFVHDFGSTWMVSDGGYEDLVRPKRMDARDGSRWQKTTSWIELFGFQAVKADTVTKIKL